MPIGATTILLAQARGAEPISISGSAVGWVLLLSAIALGPFLLAVVTSFAKLFIVGAILRQALGMPSALPNVVLAGVAVVLSGFIMWPVGDAAWRAYRSAPAGSESERWIASVVPPMRDFLARHASPRNLAFFQRLAGGEPGAGEPADAAGQPTLRTLVPAFMLTELIEAFQIGFLIFVPFVVIDLVVSNVLLAMGMHMLSPLTLSLPLKLLLFVLVDGWTLIVQGLVLGYQ